MFINFLSTAQFSAQKAHLCVCVRARACVLMLLVCIICVVYVQVILSKIITFNNLHCYFFDISRSSFKFLFLFVCVRM